MKNKILHNKTNMLVGKTFFFTPDEANVDDLAKACEFTIKKFILFSDNTDLVSYTRMLCLRVMKICRAKTLTSKL